MQAGASVRDLREAVSSPLAGTLHPSLTTMSQ